MGQSNVDSFHRDGFATAIPALPTAEAREIRAAIERLEQSCNAGVNGRNLDQYFRVNGHIVIPLLAELSRTQAVLDVIEQVLGPNLLVWSVELFIKEGMTDKIVTWHQDITYWGMGDTDHEVTAWIALSDVSIKSGCMRFIPGSHQQGLAPHEDTFETNNLLSRGQQISDVDESRAVYGQLKPGEMSLHHGRCFHASGPNQLPDRRIGAAIRYVTPEVGKELGVRDYAMLVRGEDTVGRWTHINGAKVLFGPSEIALYEAILKDQALALTAGSDADVALYS